MVAVEDEDEDEDVVSVPPAGPPGRVGDSLVTGERGETLHCVRDCSHNISSRNRPRSPHFSLPSRSVSHCFFFLFLLPSNGGNRKMMGKSRQRGVTRKTSDCRLLITKITTVPYVMTQVLLPCLILPTYFNVLLS